MSFLLAADGADVATAAAAVIAAVIAGASLALTHSARSDAVKANRTAEAAVDQAKRQAGIAEQTLAASVRPVIVGATKLGAPFHYQTTPDPQNRFSANEMAFYIRFPVRNVGPGPALIHSVTIEIPVQYDESRVKIHAQLDHQVLEPEVETELCVDVPTAANPEAVRVRDEILEAGVLAVIQYSDAALGRRMITTMSLTARRDNRAFVMESLRVHECEDGTWTPKATSFAEM